MLLKINEYEIFVKFNHNRNARTTTCSLTVAGQDYPEGLSSCSEKDNFRYSEGRKIALVRALNNVMNREQRKEFWKAYWAKRKEQTRKDWIA